jgi:hypothetical protein
MDDTLNLHKQLPIISVSKFKEFETLVTNIGSYDLKGRIITSAGIGFLVAGLVTLAKMIRKRTLIS